MFHAYTEDLQKSPQPIELLLRREMKYCRDQGWDFAMLGDNCFYLFTFAQLPETVQNKIMKISPKPAPLYMWRVVYDSKTFEPIDTSMTSYSGVRNEWTDHLPVWPTRK